MNVNAITSCGDQVRKVHGAYHVVNEVEQSHHVLCKARWIGGGCSFYCSSENEGQRRAKRRAAGRKLVRVIFKKR